jgi:RNA polymerase-binding transcription factor DksA
MTKHSQQFYRRALQELAARLQGDSDSVTEAARDPAGHGAGELSNVPMHLGDMGTDEYLRDLNVTLLQNEEYLLGEIMDALKRLDEGSFGRCENCGKPIAQERLEAIPYTRFCRVCAEQVGSGAAANIDEGRPRQPTDTLALQDSLNRRRRRRDPSLFTDAPAESERREGDIHASGTPGGGTAAGGLAGTNEGHGDPDVPDLQDAMGSGEYDRRDADEGEGLNPQSGRAGGAVGGTPAGKRSGQPPAGCGG